VATIGIIGLGRMGGNMAKRIKQGGHTVVGYDQAAGERDVASPRATPSKSSEPCSPRAT
jgi:6-phosphogluconate dehydrogenase